MSLENPINSDSTIEIPKTNVENNEQPIQLVDVFNVPMVFRGVNLAEQMEIGIRGKTSGMSKFIKNLSGLFETTQSPLRNSVGMYSESPLMYFKPKNKEGEKSKIIEHLFDKISKYREISFEKLENLLELATSMTLVEESEASKKTEEILNLIYNDFEYLNIYLALQEVFLKSETDRPFDDDKFKPGHDRLINSYASGAMYFDQGFFGINLNKNPKILLALDQTHGDHGLEFLVKGELSKDNIVGFFLTVDKFDLLIELHNQPNKETNEKRVEKVFMSDLLKSPFTDNFYEKVFSVARRLSDVKGDEVTQKILSDGMRAGKKEKDIVKDIKICPLLTYSSKNFKNPFFLNEKGYSFFGISEEEFKNMTVEEYVNTYIDRTIKRLSKIFPGVSFTKENYLEIASIEFERFLKLNSELTNQLSVCIRQNIPIYDRETGDLLWPKKMSHEEVKKLVQERSNDLVQQDSPSPEND
jgi:hypothetical protein